MLLDIQSNFTYVILSLSVYMLSLTVIYQNAYDDSKEMTKFNETTLLVIAHPDDESMFFGPTIIRRLNQPDRSHLNQASVPANKFYLLCITQGDQYGLGKFRRNELVKSAIKLGIKRANIMVLDDVRWLDGDNQKWHIQSLRDLIVNEILSKNITELITFDEYGVSGHSNHQTLFKVVRSIARKMDYVKFYSLRSINLIQKYLAIFDFSIFYLFISKQTQIYLLNLNEYLKLVDAFHSHQTQLVWFRRLYIIFSKYMYINVLDELEL